MQDILIHEASDRNFSDIKFLMLTGLSEDPHAFSVSFDEYNYNSEGWWHSYIDPFTIGYSQKMLIAEIESEAVGMIGVIFDSKKRKEHIASIVWLYVLPKFRGLGVGKALMQSLLEQIQTDSKILKLSLLVNESQTSAIKLYEDFGFTESGRMKKELKIDDQFYNVLIMEKLINGAA